MRKNSKDAIVNAAIELFNTKGYNGTSVRDIAGKANVNPANIAYYFQNKEGLLEYCFTAFFENYLAEIERGFAFLNAGAAFCLKQIAANVINFQCKNIQLTRFILREMSIDSQIVREIMSTYYVKERYFFQKIIEKGMEQKEFRSHSVSYLILQFKSLLAMPFLNTHYVTEVLHVFPHEKYFAKKYLQEIFMWIDGVLCTHPSKGKEVAVIK
jgi:AcrR family transcriptional regulator